jgi:hypothetical protein
VQNTIKVQEGYTVEECDINEVDRRKNVGKQKLDYKNIIDPHLRRRA